MGAGNERRRRAAGVGRDGPRKGSERGSWFGAGSRDPCIDRRRPDAATAANSPTHECAGGESPMDRPGAAASSSGGLRDREPQIDVVTPGHPLLDERVDDAHELSRQLIDRGRWRIRRAGHGRMACVAGLASISHRGARPWGNQEGASLLVQSRALRAALPSPSGISTAPAARDPPLAGHLLDLWSALTVSAGAGWPS